MAITPQAIKDQEFLVKFRGYDAIEVKAYLELVAEEFFELFEQVRQQTDEIEGLTEEKQDLIDRHATLEGDMNALMGKNDRLTAEIEENNDRNTSLNREINELKSRIATLEKDLDTKGEDLEAARNQIEAEKEIAEKERKEKQDLLNRLAETERQWAEQKKDEIDFKETLLAAQKFSQDMKKGSEDEASEILAKARADAEKLRQDTLQELARYPKEIERLKAKRNQVREDLRTVLAICLESLDIFDDEKAEEDDFSDLFQSVVVSDEGKVDLNDMSKLDMELDLLDSLHAEEESVSAAANESNKDDAV